MKHWTEKLYSLVCTYADGTTHKAHVKGRFDECLGTEAWITREHHRTGEELPKMEIIEEKED